MTDNATLSTPELIEEAFRTALTTLMKICQAPDLREARIAAADLGRLLAKTPRVLADKFAPRPKPTEEDVARANAFLDQMISNPPELISSTTAASAINKAGTKQRTGFKDRPAKSR